MENNREIIGITGGIGSGKSVVSRILRLNGLTVYDCDMEARLLMENDPVVRENLVKILGDDTYHPTGKLNRQHVSSCIFSDKELLKRVNEVVHEAVRDHFRRFICSLRRPVFCESAILVTSGLDTLCDRIWLVEAPEAERVSRVVKRSGLEESEIRQRMKSQEKEFDFRSKDKRVELIDNSGRTSLLERISCLLPDLFPTLKTDEYKKWSLNPATINY